MAEAQVGQAVVPLLKGVVYADSDPAAWQALMAVPNAARDYLAAIGLEVIIDEAEEYAYLRQRDAAADAEAGGEDAAGAAGDAAIPRLIARRPLSYRVTVLLALLRLQLMELDASGDETRLVLTREQIVELVRTYHPERHHEAKLADAVESDLRRIMELGMVRALRDQPHTYEVRRIIKAFVDAQWLNEVAERLAELAESQGESA